MTDRISALQAERAALAQVKRSRAEVIAHIDATLAAWQEQAKQQLRADTLALTTDADAPFPIRDGIPIGPTLVSLLGAAPLRMYLQSFVTELPNGPNAVQRAARIAEIDAELAASERA